MSKKIGYLQRWMLVVDTIDRNPYIGLDQLVEVVEKELPLYDGVEETGISRRTILRDIKEIRASPYFDVEIEYNLTRKGYTLRKNELFQSKADRMIELTSLVGLRELQHIVFPEARKPQGLEQLPRLITAIKKSQVVEIEYLKFDNTLSRKRRVEPYALKEFRGRWYLLAPEIDGDPSEQGQIKTWGLDRIKTLTATGRTFKKTPNLNPVAEFETCFGIYSNEEQPVQEVILSFSPLSGRYNDAFPLHESQETFVDTDQEFRIKLNVRITEDFVMELLSQSEGLLSVSPEALRTRLIECHQKAIENLTKNKV